MSIEGWMLSESTNKKEKKDEEKKKEIEKIIYYEKKKEKIKISIEVDSELLKLKELIKDKSFDIETSKIANKVINKENINSDDIQTIFDKIDIIENNDKIDKYIPKDFRITKEEYKKAIYDQTFRKSVILKLNMALSILSNHIKQEWNLSLNLFSWFLITLDINLVYIQENHIDIKNSLKELDKENKKLSLWERFIKFLKELFS